MRIKQFLVLASVLALGVVIGRLEIALVLADDERSAGKTSVFNLDNCVTEFSEDRVEKTEKGWRFWFVPKSVSKTFNFKVSSVRGRSANHDAHAHGEEEIFYVFEGTAKFTLNGESKIVGQDSTLFCPSGVPHGIFNAGDTPLRYAVIKSNYPDSDE